MDIAHAYDIELEGACEGSLACSTCHVVVEETFYDQLPEPSDEENDMLDLAFALTVYTLFYHYNILLRTRQDLDAKLK